jgi:hypothetical protein
MARVAHDRQQPRAAARPAEPGEVPDRPEQRVLHGVLCVVVVAQQPARDAVGHVEVDEDLQLEA